MEIFLTREEIRRRLQARLGHVTGDGQAPLIQTAFNEYIRAAALEVYTRCQWIRSQRESFISIGIDQRLFNYPANTGPENILSIGLWDEAAQQYRTLRRTPIQVKLDDEPLVAIGGDTSAAGRGMPVMYECRTQIETYPRADIAYDLKIDHTVNPEFATDADVSVVDAEAILLWAQADAFDFQGDERLADIARGKFEARIDKLIRWQSNMPTLRRGSGNRAFANRRRQNIGYVPNSGTWPSVMPNE